MKGEPKGMAVQNYEFFKRTIFEEKINLAVEIIKAALTCS